MPSLPIRRHTVYTLAAAGVLLGGCQASTPGSQPAATQAGSPTLSFDRQVVERALIEAPAIDWSYNTFSSPSLLAGRAARAAQRAAQYHTAAAGWPASNWSKTISQTVSNSPVYISIDPYKPGPTPYVGDRLAFMTSAIKGTPGFFVVNPSTGAALNGGGWDVLTNVGAPLGDQVSGSALATSAQGSQAMFVTNAGYFGAVSMVNGAKTGGFTLGVAQSSVNAAPFVDNSAHPGFDKVMEVWCATTNASASVGQLHHLSFAANAWTYPGGALAVSGPAADGSAGVVTAAGFKASPIVWQGKVYIGDTLGRLWEYTIATGTARYWDLSPFSGMTTDQILAPVAIDFGTGDAVIDIFVACGTRVFWIDPVTKSIAPSQSLVLDTATAAPGPKLEGPIYAYSFAGTTVGPYNAVDTVTVATSPFFTDNGDGFGNEVVGADALTTTVGDVNRVSGFMLFNVPSGAFGGKLPVKATLNMMNDPYSITDGSDVGSIFRGSIFFSNGSGADTGTIWNSGGFSATNVPRYLVPTAFSSRVGPVTQGVTYQWDISGAVPNDNNNYCFIERGAGKHYNPGGAANTTAPGYYGAFSPNPPFLTVSLSPYGPTGAIMSQPILFSDPVAPKLYIANANALFEVDYASSGNFSSSSKTRFSLMASGRGGAGNVGVVDATSKFIRNQISVALALTGSQYFGYVVGENGVGGMPHLNKFKIPFDAVSVNPDDLVNVYNLPAGSKRSTPFLVTDYFGGSIYVADQAAASTLVRLPQ